MAVNCHFHWPPSAAVRACLVLLLCVRGATKYSRRLRLSPHRAIRSAPPAQTARATTMYGGFVRPAAVSTNYLSTFVARVAHVQVETRVAGTSCTRQHGQLVWELCTYCDTTDISPNRSNVTPSTREDRGRFFRSWITNPLNTRIEHLRHSYW